MTAVTITQITPPELVTLIENTLKNILEYKKPDIQKETDQLLTIEEIADFLHLSRPTIYSLVSRSEIPCMKKGKRLYFSKDEVTEWLKTGKKKTSFELAKDADSFLTKRERRVA